MFAPKYVFLVILILTVTNIYSQFTLDAELRPRFEYRHGYKNLFPDNTEPAAFVSQRTRLNFSYKTEKLHFYLSPQDVRVWGDVPQLNVADENGFSLHQAWADVVMVPDLSLKIGRQEIVYDDQRFFGNVGWAQQGRSHDAAILKYEPSFLKLHFGAAYNQDGEALTGNILKTNTYKSLQYVWLDKDWEKLSASFLFLNNGLQYIDETDKSKNDTRYSQTAGLHLNANLSKFNFASNLYYQFGNDVANNDLSAYLLSLEANYSALENLRIGIGAELQSGNDYGAPANGENKAFNPLYGTNHKFNGFMDYFYVGNHINNVGLVDFYGNVKYAFTKKSNVYLALHQFFAAAEIDDNTSKVLGFEVDLVTSFKTSNFTGIQAGYSHFFISKGIEILKNNFDGNTNNWAWVMVTIDPALFTWKKPEIENNNQ
ncbi:MULTISPECIES: alginate export family protein [Aequorivita]|uniref:Alginate export family protein n=1 Tax=Aequorivita iocasae TaxID=2803865 RepID=A0ABX7DPW0_9FLAO|nr:MULTISPECIES: alginate export family protein [Aequorivita]QQX75837.1 alginate export family protein [Aequorivita iocasae]UCA55297.1 alginate export family protein [Aequorivita sp. F7]